jgi:Phage terminase large subunit/Terminase RNaseH-like domain
MTSFSLTPKQQEAQKILGGDQRHTMLVGGSRSTKTFTFVRSTMARAVRSPESRHAIFRLRSNAARTSVALDTMPKVARMCFNKMPLREHRQDGYFELPNKSQIWVGGLDDKKRVEKILGNEYATIFFNECSQIPYSSVLTALTRLAQNADGLRQRAYYDLNPVGKNHWTNRLFIQKVDPVSRQALPDPENYAHFFMNPKDNPLLSADYLRSLENASERHRRRFYDGQYVDEIDGALWTWEMIEACRVDREEVPELRRVIVAVDPSGADGKEDMTADEIGIVVVGLGVNGHLYVLSDRSRRDAPAVWGRIAVTAYHEFMADRIVAEINFGGEMVRYVIQTQDKAVPVSVITASRGKSVRAEPVSSLYEKGLVHHVGKFDQLEDQLCGFSTAGYTGDGSPDRADALVWAVTDLALGQTHLGFLDYARAQVEGNSRAAAEAKLRRAPVEGTEVTNLGEAPAAREALSKETSISSTPRNSFQLHGGAKSQTDLQAEKVKPKTVAELDSQREVLQGGWPTS